MAQYHRYFVWLFIIMAFIFLPGILIAQEETETPLAPASLTATGTPTATASPTLTATHMATSTATATATATLTETSSPTATIPPELTVEMTEAILPSPELTIEMTATHTASATASPISTIALPIIVTNTATATATETIVPEVTAEMTEPVIIPEMTAEVTESVEITPEATAEVAETIVPSSELAAINAEVPPVIIQNASPPITNCAIDLIFMADQSNGFSDDDFDKEKDFILGVLNHLPMDNPDDVWAGIGYIDSFPSVEIPLTSDKTTIVTAVTAHARGGGFSNISDAINEAQYSTDGFASSTNRPDVQDVMLLLTDGVQFPVNPAQSPFDSAEDARGEGTILFTVGVPDENSGVDTVTLDAIANDPDSDFMYLPTDSNGLLNINGLTDTGFIEMIANRICEEEAQPPINCNGLNSFIANGVDTENDDPNQCPSPVRVTVDQIDTSNNNQYCSLSEAIQIINGGISPNECDVLGLPEGSISEILITTPSISISQSHFPPGNNGANGLPVICCSVIVEGNGAIIERSSSAANFRIFEVGATANVTFQNLTIKNGHADTEGGGAILSAGDLTLTNVTISDNEASGERGDGGGINMITADTTLSITGSVFTGNMANNGGAIAIQGVDTLISNSYFENNNATTNGNALYLFNPFVLAQPGNSYIRDSCLVNNGDTGTSPYDITFVVNFFGATVDIDATGNWWNDQLGANSNDGEYWTSIQNEGDGVYNVETSGYQTTPPQQQDCITVSTPTLADYGIETSGWNDPLEIIAIEDAVTNVASALYSVANRPDLSQQEVFKQIMIGSNVTGLRIIEDDLPSGGGNGGCITEPFPTNGYFQIKCDVALLDWEGLPTSNQITEYTIVHELGHLFVGRTGGTQIRNPDADPPEPLTLISFYERITKDQLNDNLSTLVMGNRIYPVPDGSSVNDWWRGDRGWGSHARPFPQIFQQNIYCVIDNGQTNLTLTREREEATADMFLNWVYWKNTNGGAGFKNIDWLFDTPGGCPITEAENSITQSTEQPGTVRATRTNNAVVIEIGEILAP